MESPKSRSSPLKKNRLPRPRKAPEGLGSGSAPSPLATKRSEEHTSELQSRLHLVCRLLLEKKKKILFAITTAEEPSKLDVPRHRPALNPLSDRGLLQPHLLTHLTEVITKPRNGCDDYHRLL